MTDDEDMAEVYRKITGRDWTAWYRRHGPPRRNQHRQHRHIKTRDAVAMVNRYATTTLDTMPCVKPLAPQHHPPIFIRPTPVRTA